MMRGGSFLTATPAVIFDGLRAAVLTVVTSFCASGPT